MESHAFPKLGRALFLGSRCGIRWERVDLSGESRSVVTGAGTIFTTPGEMQTQLENALMSCVTL
eukprot:5794310-Amphidinium_carterae.1